MAKTILRQLWRGESDQPPQTRLEGQVDSALNARLDVTFSGPTRRNPTNLIADLAGLTALRDYFFIQIRDAIVLLAEDEIKAFRLTDGLALTVIDNTPAADQDLYLRTGTTGPLLPNSDLVATVSVDTAFVANRTITPKILTGWTYQQIMNFIFNGDETNGSGSPVIVDNTAAPVTPFSDLPPAPADGDVQRVLLDENLDPHGIYIAFSGTRHATFPDGFYPNHGIWYRIPTASQPEARWNLATLPHILTYDDVALTVTYDRAPWRQRISGNEATNRVSHVKDSVILEIQFLQSRLILITQNHLVGTRGNNFFTLWLNNAGVPNDEDRIDLDLAMYRNLGRPLRAMVLGHSLLLGMENGQMAFGSGALALTAVNGSFRVISQFPTRDVAMGDAGDLGFLIDEHGWVHNYAVFDRGGVSTPGYLAWANIHRSRLFETLIPRRLFAFDRTLFITTDDGKIIVHDQFSVGGEIVQSAWSELDFYADTLHVARWADVIYLVQSDAQGFSIVDYHHHDIAAPTGMLYPPRLDRMELAGGTYDSADNETTFTHTGRSGDAKSTLVVRPPSTRHEIPKLKRVETSGDVVFDGGSGTGGDWDAQAAGVKHFLGFGFTTEVELNEFWPNLDESVIAVQQFTIHHFETSDYELVIPRRDKDDSLMPFDARRAPFVAGVAGSSTGFSKNSVTFDGRRVRPRIRSSSPGTFTIIGVGYNYQVQDSD